jgi:hypothetical protein
MTGLPANKPLKNLYALCILRKMHTITIPTFRPLFLPFYEVRLSGLLNHLYKLRTCLTMFLYVKQYLALHDYIFTLYNNAKHEHSRLKYV